MSRLKDLVLVRHGETVGQSSIRYFGATDIGLSALGRRQMACVRTALAGRRFDAVYTSKLQRTRAAAEIISPDVPATALTGFDEINFGDWEGLTREEIRDRDGDLFRQWEIATNDFAYPGGETISTFRTRVARAFETLRATAPERALVIAHKGVIRTIVAELLPLNEEELSAMPIDLGSVHLLRREEERWYAETLNLTRHLQESPQPWG